LRRIEGRRVFAPAGQQLAAGKMQIAPEVVNFGKRAIVDARDGQRLRLGQRRKGVVDSGDQPICRGAAE
jgi:hypothetical protein